MGKYVMISYSTKEMAEAYQVKSVLESNGIPCWMAPDSIEAGKDYGESVPEAIEKCAVFLLMLSENAQISTWVPKELITAINANRVIIPFRIDDSDLNRMFAFHLANVQRIDAYSNIQTAYTSLLNRIQAIFDAENQNAKMNPSETFEKKVFKLTDDVAFEARFSTSNSYLLIKSNIQQSEKVYFDFTKERFDALKEATTELLAFLFGSEKDLVMLKAKDPFGPLPAYRGARNDDILKSFFHFDMNFLPTEEKDYDPVLTLKPGKVEISLHSKSGGYYYEGMDLEELNQKRPADFGIDEAALLKLLEEALPYFNPCAKAIRLGKVFTPKFYKDYSGGFILNYIAEEE